MIRRTGDYSSLPDKDFNKIASVVNKTESKQLFNSYEDKSKAELIALELKVKGFKVELNKTASSYDVYTIKSESIPYDKALKSGQFEKLAWGRYCFQRQSQIGMFEHNFDDGSIWRLSTDENGESILIKEFQDDNEEDVIRNIQDNRQNVKVAGKKEIKYSSDVTVKNIGKILYDCSFSDEFLHEATPDVKSSLYKMFNKKMDTLISSKLEQHNIVGEKDVYDIKKLTATALAMEVNSKYNLTKFINAVAKDHLEKIGQQRKLFKKD